MTRYIALFGDPVAGNPTSRMQNAAFRSTGLDWRYLDIRVEARRLGEAVQAARVLGFGGLNLTLPHKISVIPYLDGLERSAEISGAVNTVRVDPDGRLIGLNTDGLGFLHALRDAEIDPAGRTVVLLGAGGAARAVAVEIALAGAARVVVASRSAGQRDELVAMIGDRTPAQARGLDWTGELDLPSCDLLVNCTGQDPVQYQHRQAALSAAWRRELEQGTHHVQFARTCVCSPGSVHQFLSTTGSRSQAFWMTQRRVIATIDMK